MKLHFFLDIIQLFFPKTCFSCNKVISSNERIICLKCYIDLPKYLGKKNKHKFNLYVDGKIITSTADLNIKRKVLFKR